MDKKYIADKRDKSKKYKNPKYNKKADIAVDKNNVSSDHRTSSKRLHVDDKSQQIQIEEDVVPNNWSRYELSNDDENWTSQGADYETLLLAPVSVDSHFKFKSEQNWDEDIKSQVDLSKYFTLNIALLNEGISCVPFLKRQGYDESIVSPLELELMKSTSAANLEKYNKLLERKFPQTKCDIIITENVIKNNEVVTKIKNEITQVIKPQIPVDDVDDLLNLKCADLVINDELHDIKVEVIDPLLEKIELGKVIAPQQQPTLDLEQWLDDILDE